LLFPPLKRPALFNALRELDCDGIVTCCERDLRRECVASGVKRIEVACAANSQRRVSMSCHVREDDTQKAMCRGIARI
jgi:hypothetical protein